MIKFIGEHRVKLDDKGRLIFPAAFKSLIGNTSPMQLVVKNDLYEKCLVIYTYDEWRKESDEIKSKLNFFNKEHSLFWRNYMSNRALIEPDEKLGRITIPKKLLESIEAKKDLVFFGNDHKIELWANENYDEINLDSSQFVSLAEKILG